VSTLQELETNNELLDQKLSFTNRFNDKRVFLLTGRYIEENTPQDYRINRFLYENLFPETGEINNVAQKIQSRMSFAGIEGHLLDRWENGHLFEMQAGSQYRKDQLNSSLELEEGENISQIPPDFKNNTSYAS